MTYRYQIIRESKPVSELSGAPEIWLTARLNEIGARGGRLTSFGEFTENSALRDSQGRVVPAWGFTAIIMFTEAQ